MSEFLTSIDWSQWLDTLQDWGWRILAAVLIYLIGWWITRQIRKGFVRVLLKRGWDGILTRFIGNVAQVTLLMVIIIAALDTLGMQTSSLLAVLGAAGLAIGLALKDSLGNLASGVMLVGLRPFREGDYVEVADIGGTVTHVQLFNTTLVTADNRRIIVPNSQVTGNIITNYTALSMRRIDLVIGVSYSDDLKVAENTIREILIGHEKVLAEPAPVILLLELADSSINFAARPWVNKDDYWSVRSELLHRLKTGLEAAGCHFPFPQRDIHVQSLPGVVVTNDTSEH